VKRQFCIHCGSGIGPWRREGEGSCPECWLNVLIGCEISGLIRDEFRALGHNAWSCDLYDIEDVPPHWPQQQWPNYHLTGDVRWWLDPKNPPDMGRYTNGRGWDLLIAMPPCTYLANIGVQWLYTRDEQGERRRNPERWAQLDEAAQFFNEMLDAPVPHIAVENPTQHKHAIARIPRRYAQGVQPFQFGHAESKATYLWLKNLPPLVPTCIVPPPYTQRVWKMGPGKWRQMDRSLTYPGIAKAMARQWSAYIQEQMLCTG
jgi:hypothetical protein